MICEMPVRFSNQEMQLAWTGPDEHVSALQSSSERFNLKYEEVNYCRAITLSSTGRSETCNTWLHVVSLPLTSGLSNLFITDQTVETWAWSFQRLTEKATPRKKMKDSCVQLRIHFLFPGIFKRFLYCSTTFQLPMASTSKFRREKT